MSNDNSEDIHANHSPAEPAITAHVGTALATLRPTTGPAAADAPQATRSPKEVNPALMVHSAMRGRYRMAIVLGLVASLVLAVVGWKAGKPQYHSTGLVRISYEMPEVIQETDQNKPLLMFDTFMTSQRLLITSRRVIDSAVQDPVWKATGRPVPLNPDQYFAEHMTVDIKPKSEFISILVTDPEPGTAAVAVTSIINAYSDLYNGQERQLDRQRLGVLEDRQTALQGKIDQLTAQIRANSQEFGTTKLDVFYEAAAFRLTKLEAALADVRLALAGYSAADPLIPSVEQIAIVDPVMRTYLDDLIHLQNERNRLAEFGLLDGHRDVQRTQHALDAATLRVQRYAQMYAEYHSATAQNPGEPAKLSITVMGKTQEQLKENQASLEKVLKDSKLEMVTLGNKKLELDRQEADLSAAVNELAQLTRRMEILRAEGSLGGRLNVISSGEIALAPDKDYRVRLGVAGAGIGLILPAGLIVLLSLVYQQYRYSSETVDDSASAKFPLLGILPHLNEKQASDDAELTAAQCIHQIRVSLQSMVPDGSARSYLVTSAMSGEGKTSLVMGLGLSFAASRLKTLVIDGDLIGRRLTSAMQAKKVDGLHELLAGRPVESYIQDDGTGLHILAAGGGGMPDASTLPLAAVKTFLRQAHKSFDVVLIDTGPILGSVEAAVFAREVDGVIFAISRKQSRAPVQAAMRRLESLGANIAGIVFNRAKPEDLHSSVFSSSLRSLPAESAEEAAPRARSNKAQRERFGRFGPLVQAVAASLPTLAPMS